MMSNWSGVQRRVLTGKINKGFMWEQRKKKNNLCYNVGCDENI